MTDYEKLYADALTQEYAPKNTAKSAALRKLDRKAKLPAYIFTYTFGVIAALLLGVGMCLSMKVIGSGSAGAFGAGIAVGVVGLVMIAVNYPIFSRMLESGKRKYAADILRLAQEIREG